MQHPRAASLPDQLHENGAFLLHLAAGLVGEERAADVVQDAYVRALERPPRTTGSLRAWLAVVVSNLARNERRRSDRSAERERLTARDERVEPGPAALETLELQQRLLAEVAALSEEQRTVLVLRYHEGLTPSVIAKRLGAPVATIKARQTRALAELRARLDARSGGDRTAWMPGLAALVRRREGAPSSAGASRLVAAKPLGLALGLAAAAVVGFVWWGAARSGAVRAVPLRPVPAAPAAPAVPATPAVLATSEASPARELSAPETIAPPPASTSETATPVPTGLTFVVEVDLARARATALVPADFDDAPALELVARTLRRRLAALGVDAKPTLDPVRNRIELAGLPADERAPLEDFLRDFGLCELLVLADETSLEGLGIDLAGEERKLATWRAAHPELPLAEFDLLDAADGGPHPRLAWLSTSFGGREGPPRAVLVLQRLSEHFGAASFAHVFKSVDAFGYPSLAFDLRADRLAAFERLVAERPGQRLAVVVGGALRSAPELLPDLVRGGSIEGRFGGEELDDLADALRRGAGPLRIVEIRTP